MGTGLRRIDNETRAVRVKDADGNVVKLGYILESDGTVAAFPINRFGGVAVRTSDAEAIEIFDQILIELKKISFQLSILTETEIDDGDL